MKAFFKKKYIRYSNKGASEPYLTSTLISDAFPDRIKCPPTKMKDYSPERLPPRPPKGGRLNEDLLVVPVAQGCR